MALTLGIRGQLIAGIVLTTLAGIGLIGILSLKMIERRAVYWKADEAAAVARTVSAVMERGAPGGQPGPIAYAAIVFKEAGITDYRLSVEGRVLIEAGDRGVPGGAEVPYDGNIKMWMIGGGGLFAGPGKALRVQAQLARAGGGMVEFAVPLAGIREDISGIRRFLLFYAILDSAVIIAFGVYFLSRSIVRPIQRLDETAMRIAGGRLEDRADVAIDNEIGSLAASFNTMAGRLSDEIKSLERVNRDLVEAQEELMRSSTLAAVGRLAAGIAHEIGNPLGALRGYLDIVQKGGLDPGDEKEVVERAGGEVARIDAIVRDFLDIARPPRKPERPADVNAVVNDALASVSVRKDFAALKTSAELDARVPGARVDEGKLRQVVVNLLTNAAHSAASAGGERAVTVATAVEVRRPEKHGPRRRKDDPPPVFSEAEAGERPFVVVSVTDTGPGISEEDAMRIFDPFFTTKAHGLGTGLGLFVSQSIVVAYGGEIRLLSSREGATTFAVSVPAWGEA